MVGLALVGLAAALGILIGSQPRDPGPPEDLPRALAIPALYATVGLLAIVGAVRSRPAIVVAAGALCVAGTLISLALLPFAVPGLLLIFIGVRIHTAVARSWSEAVIAAVVVLLVVGAAIAPFVMAEERCWQGARSSADPPTYTQITVVPCGSQPASDAGGVTYASGSETGVLTTAGGVVEAALLLAALAVTSVTGRRASRTRAGPSIDQAARP